MSVESDVDSFSGPEPARPDLFSPGRNCYRVARAEHAALLIDGSAYFAAFARAALRARRSIIIIGWDFHSRTQLHHGVDGIPDLLGDFLNFLARRWRPLEVFILVWDYSVFMAKDREPSPAYSLGWRPHRRVRFRYDSNYPLGAALHQKIVVIDGVLAFCGGLDLTRGRWDTPEHLAWDPRRASAGESEQYAPFHDAMLAVTGESARVLHDLVNERWRDVTGTVAVSKRYTPELAGQELCPEIFQQSGQAVAFRDVDVAIARTLPSWNGEEPVTEVEALYLDMIAAARRYIYIESQYFTARALADAIARRLQEPHGPEVIAVLRLRSHGWLEAPTMGTLRTVLLSDLRKADRYDRFHAYYPHIEGLPEHKCCDLHTKLVIVDDEWLRVGSANFANRSMRLDTECDLVIAAHSDERQCRQIKGARDRLLAEHLDVPQSVLTEGIRAQGSLGDAIKVLLKPDGRSLQAFARLDPPSPALIAVGSSLADRDRPLTLDEYSIRAPQGATMAEAVPSAEQHAVRLGRIALVATAVVLSGLVALWHFSPLASLAEPERIVEQARELANQPWAALLAIALYIPVTLTLFPRSLLTLFAVVAFGPWVGVAVALTGIVLAAWVTYGIGQRLHRRTVRRVAGRRLVRVAEILSQRGVAAMAALRLVPLAPFLVVNIVAGAFDVPLGAYLAGTALGVLPGTLVACLLGNQLVAGLHDPHALRRAWILGPLILMAASIWAMRRWLFGSATGHAARR